MEFDPPTQGLHAPERRKDLNPMILVGIVISVLLLLVIFQFGKRMGAKDAELLLGQTRKEMNEFRQKTESEKEALEQDLRACKDEIVKKDRALGDRVTNMQLERESKGGSIVTPPKAQRGTARPPKAETPKSVAVPPPPPKVEKPLKGVVVLYNDNTKEGGVEIKYPISTGEKVVRMRYSTRQVIPWEGKDLVVQIDGVEKRFAFDANDPEAVVEFYIRN